MEAQEDIKIIDSSLHFINDLLRNMLDMQRAGSNQIPFEIKPTDIMNDVFKPVEAMMHLRDVPFEAILECGSSSSGNCVDEDDHLVVMTDPLRLKQVVLNLTSNAIRFVEKGFIRCGAKVNPDSGFVELYVDDSGPGIPEEKRARVFGKFQQSLDSLQQGTGIGLSLCKKMIDLMGGCLYIDDDYHSGIEGCPGTRFVIQLKIPPLQLDNAMLDDQVSCHVKARRRRRVLLSCSKSTHSSKAPLSSPAMTTNSVEESKEQTKHQTMVQTSASSISTASTLTSIENTGNTDRLSKVSDGNTIINSIIQPASPETDEPRKRQDEQSISLPTALPSTLDSEEIVPDETMAVVNREELQPDLLTELPEYLSVLFVDDDMILRKLFSRTLKKINPTWSLHEASSGEIAIELITPQQDEGRNQFGDDGDDVNKDDDARQSVGFDLIFMDQYMASVQKQLLGTETVRAIRAKGFHNPIICGLSANDVEDAFHHAGSDAFMFKPFPCKKDELKRELLRIINTRRRHCWINATARRTATNSQ